MLRKKRKNYLDFIPVHNANNTWDERDEVVTIHMVNRGFYPWIAQKFFGSPRVSHIDLDAYGSYLWKLIDGGRSVGELADNMSARFGKDAEPLYDRLVKYMQILRNNNFIDYLKNK